MVQGPMLANDAIRHFKSKMALARALGVTRQAVQGWARKRSPLPIDRAFQVQDLTKGKLKVNFDLYRRDGGT